MTPVETLTLAAYFFVLIILAVYGWHRYYLVYLYMRNRDREPKPGPALLPLPAVTIQLPLYNEMYVADRIIESVCRIEYPRELLEIQVLDDSVDETRSIAELAVRRFAEEGIDIKYFHRTDRTGFKAGALEAGLKVARGEFIAIFDADFTPGSDFLARLMPNFADPGVGMVQARWGHINQDYSLLTRIQSILLDGHFVLEHGGRYRSGRFFNFNGTAGVWRRQAIDEAGGWKDATLTEDTDLSYRSQLKGWKFLYLPQIECASELPVDMNGFKAQQARWAKGLMQTAKKILPKVLRSDAPWHVKAEAFFHLTANISYPLMVLLSTMLLPVMIVRFQQGWFQMLLIDLPLFLASTCSISSFYLVAQRELRPKTWWRTFFYMPFVMATGIGISIRNAQAVIEALLGKKSEFARTPKFNIEGKQGTFAKKSYRNKAGWMPYAEVLLGLYFSLTIVYAISNENYATVPFLLLFVWGYLYTGCMSLGQTYFARLRFGVNAPEMRPATSGAPGF